MYRKIKRRSKRAQPPKMMAQKEGFSNSEEDPQSLPKSNQDHQKQKDGMEHLPQAPGIKS